MLHEPLAYLLGDEYAEEFYRATGRWPSHVPTSGEWPHVHRTWRSYSPPRVLADDTRRSSEGTD